MNRLPSSLPDVFELLTQALQHSGRLSESVLAFIDTALFPAQPERLRAFFADDDGPSDRDSLLDLIFSPDLEVQISLEPLLDAARWTVDDHLKLHRRLLASTIHTWIRMPDGDPLARILVTEDIKSRYLKRLNLAWQLDPRVRTSIDQGVAGAIAPKIKVRLRNGHLRPSARQQKVLSLFFERMADDDPDYLACLDLFLSLMETLTEDLPFYDLLAAHKRFLFRSLRQAQRFEDLRRQSNMETLMLQGVRAPHASREALVKQMRLIDLICTGMYGKTEAIAPIMDAPSRSVTGLDDPAGAVRALLDI